jgi:hypothetical protein
MLYSTLEEAYPAANNTSRNKRKKEKVEETPVYKPECSPLQVPEYKLPIDSSSMDSFKKAIDVSLNTVINQSMPLLNSSNINTVEPYDYDEYDAYLNINNIETNKMDNSPIYRTTPLLGDYLKSLRNNYDKLYPNQGIKIDNIEHFTNSSSNKITVDVNLYNLFLFIFIGIIIILLCDQITKLAIIIANKNI